MITLNAQPAIGARLVTTWNGAWFAEVDLDLSLVGVVPTGPALLTLGANTLVGTVDDRGTGKLGAKAKVRVVGGRGGWDKALVPFHLHNDAGVVSTLVFATAGGQVGEVVVEVAPPKILGTDYVITDGPASRVLEGRDWYVNGAGVTIVGPRVPIPVDPVSFPVLDWHPDELRAELAVDELVVPGMILIDPRFGTATVRDVEQVFSEGGAHVNAWCGDVAISRAADALAAFVREKSGVHLLAKYRYRVVLDGGDGRLQLQAIERDNGIPDLLFIRVFAGLPGASVKPALGSEVVVEFLGGDANRPVVTSFEPGIPALEIDLVALLVKFGVGTSPIALMAGLLTWAAQVEAGLSAAGHPVATPLAATPGASSIRVVSD